MIVTADDLGLHPSIDQGILEAHRHGVVTCASLVSCGESFVPACEALQSTPELKVAVHLTLVEERPVSPPSEVPSLTGPGGRFPLGYRDFIRRFLTGRIRLSEVARELRAQVERVLAAGITPVHLNSHQHLHMLPGVWEAVLRLASEYGIPNLRLSTFGRSRIGRSPLETLYRSGLNLLARRAVAASATSGSNIRLTPTVGLHAAGRLQESTLRAIVATLPPGEHELVCHPGRTTASLRERYSWGFDWSAETAALCAVSREELTALGVELISG